MSRVLVTYVGGNDPWGRPDDMGRKTEGPILSILEHLKAEGKLPDRVLLLTTKTHQHKALLKDGTTQTYEQGGMETRDADTRKEIQNLYGSQVKSIITCELAVNPADLDEVIQATWEALKGKINHGDEVHVNITSGTPAMSAAIMFLIDSGYLPYQRVWQSLDPRPLPPNAKRVKEVNLGYLAERDRLERAVDLLKAMAFSQAGLVFEEISTRSFLPERRPKAKSIASLMRVYQLWDQAEFQQALNKFEETKKALQAAEIWGKLPNLKNQLETLQNICKDLETGKKQYGKAGETESILLDIYAALARRHKSGNYINVVTKGRRLYEGILNYLIYQAGLNPREELKQQKSSHLEKHAMERIEYIWEGQLRELKEKAAVVQILIGEGLLNLTDDAFNNLKQQYEEFINGARNMSYDEHGLQAVSKGAGDRVVGVAADMLWVLLNKPMEELNAYPFGVNAIDQLAEAIKETI